MSVLFTNTRTRWPHNEREIFNTARGVAECSIENLNKSAASISQGLLGMRKGSWLLSRFPVNALSRWCILPSFVPKSRFTELSCILVILVTYWSILSPLSWALEENIYRS